LTSRSLRCVVMQKRDGIFFESLPADSLISYF
jgi:hypothetical protein